MQVRVAWDTHTPPNRWGNVSQTLTEAKNPGKWKWCGSGERPCCGESWEGRHWSKAVWMIYFLCCFNPPPVPPSHHWNLRDDNLLVDHLNPMRKRSVPGHLQRLKLGRASNHLCSAHSTVELGAVEGLSPPVHSNNTNGNNYGKGTVSAHSLLWGLKHTWTSHQGSGCVFS